MLEEFGVIPSSDYFSPLESDALILAVCEDRPEEFERIRFEVPYYRLCSIVEAKLRRVEEERRRIEQMKSK